MNLRVAHLLRKTERIDRDLEELDSLLNSLQMDREYSIRLRDSLIDESFRLRQLKQKINGQVIRIPVQLEAFLQETIVKKPEVAQSHEPPKPEVAQRKPIQEITLDTPKIETEKTINETTKEATKDVANSSINGSPTKQPVTSASKNQPKKPPFLFRFE
ncbi:MAG: hypothetical protein H3C43_09955 [Leptonema sp. (in: Bacteria)]|nr:hypothetical protein [Leptonema sp. (in: bacteria)]